MSEWFGVARMRMAGAWLLAGLAVGLGLAARPAAAQDEAFAQARARGELRVGVPAVVTGNPPRTPEGLGPLAAERLAERLGLRLALVQLEPSRAAAALHQGQVDLVLADDAGVAASVVVWVPSHYQVQPKAVIRSDTPLRSWDQLAGHRLCMARANTRAQALAASHAAVLQTYEAPSDALVAVREGRCDVGVIDDGAWQALMALPEWRKFSASLPAQGARAELGWLALAPQQAWLAREMRLWHGRGVWPKLAAQWARDVAFDVYLDQESIDCHG